MLTENYIFNPQKYLLLTRIFKSLFIIIFIISHTKWLGEEDPKPHKVIWKSCNSWHYLEISHDSMCKIWDGSWIITIDHQKAYEATPPFPGCPRCSHLSREVQLHSGTWYPVIDLTNGPLTTAVLLEWWNQFVFTWQGWQYMFKGRLKWFCITLEPKIIATQGTKAGRPQV